MRKNKMMRAASALLVAVLLTTSTISGTFAKYTTQDTAKDEARVAKWGVELQAEGNLFGEDYVDAIAPEGTEAAKLAVMSDTDDVDVVAPGTNNEQGLTFSINGKPEVSGKIVIEKLEVQNIFLNPNSYGVMVETKTVVTKDNYSEFVKEGKVLYIKSGEVYSKAPEAWQIEWDSNKPDFYTLEDEYTLGAVYYPIIFKLDGGTTYTAGTTATNSLNKLASTIAEKFGVSISDYTNAVNTYTFDANNNVIKFNPGTDLSTLGFGLERISWAWAFEGQNDQADTILGNIIAGLNVVKLSGGNYIKLEKNVDYSIDVKFDIAIRVEQIDEEANVTP